MTALLFLQEISTSPDAVQRWLQGNPDNEVIEKKEDTPMGSDAPFTSPSKRSAPTAGPGLRSAVQRPPAQGGDVALKRKLSSPTAQGASRPVSGKQRQPPSQTEAGTGESALEPGRQSRPPTRDKENTGPARRHSPCLERTSPIRTSGGSRSRRQISSPRLSGNEVEEDASGEAESSSPERRPFSNRCSYRLTVEPAVKKEAFVEEPAKTKVQTHLRAHARRRIASAPGRRGVKTSARRAPPSSSSSPASSALRPHSAACKLRPSATMSRPTSAGRRGKTVTLQEETEVAATRRVFRPASTLHHRSSSSSLHAQQAALPFAGIFSLTSPQSFLNIPDILGQSLESAAKSACHLSLFFKFVCVCVCVFVCVCVRVCVCVCVWVGGCVGEWLEPF